MPVVREERIFPGKTVHGTGKSWGVDEKAFTSYHVRVARQELRRAQNEEVFPIDKKQYVTLTDGKSGHGREPTVKVGGKIRYIQFGAETDLVPALLEVLRILMSKVPIRAKSPSDARGAPFRRRHYRDSFVLLRNDAVVEGIGGDFKGRARRYIQAFGPAMQAGETISFTNIQPYARRVDEHDPSWVGFRVLKRTYNAVKRNKKTAALFSHYELRPLPGGIADSEQASQGATATYAERRKVRGQWAYSGRVMRKHRIYPVLRVGPPFQGAGVGGLRRAPWTHRPGIYQAAPSSAGLRGTVGQQISRVRGSSGRAPRVLE